MRGVGPFSPGQKLFMTIGTSLLTLAAVAQLISQLASGAKDWPYYLLVVVAAASMVVIVRRTPVARKKQ